MADYLGTAAPTELLILMMMPLGSAALLVVMLAYFRQDKQSSGGLGQPAKRRTRPQAVDLFDDDDEDEEYDDEDEDELDVSVLSNFTSATSAPPQATPPVKMEMAQPAVPSPPPQSPLEPTPTTTAPATPSRPEDLPPTQPPTELLRLLHDSETDELIVQVGQHQYRKLTDISDKEMGQFILKIEAHLLAFTNGMYATRSGVKSVRIPNAGSMPPLPDGVVMPPIEQPPKTEPPPPLQPTVPPPAIILPRPTEPPLKPRTGLFGQPLPDDSLLAGFSLAGEINKVLQKQLDRSPLADTNSIEISDAAIGGIQIEVNGRIYNSPDELPDPEVKALIKRAIKEWEQS